MSEHAVDAVPTADLTARIAAVVATARQDRGWSLGELAERSGVSRAMVAKIERAVVQPSAVILARLSGALELTLSELIGRAERSGSRVSRRAGQPVWTDPVTSYRRRSVSPAAARLLEIVEVELPGGVEVALPAASYTFLDQQLLVLSGRLDFTEGAETHHLRSGDCLQLAEPRDCVFTNPGSGPTRYLVVLAKRASRLSPPPPHQEQ
jgi:transcriptional regulator with XRE-family HTH domain